MTTQVGNPHPLFFDSRGRPLDGGRIYVGVAGEDPEAEPIDVFYDPGRTDLAAQPLKTIGGLIVRDGYPTFIYAAEDAYSMRARNADGKEVFYAANANFGTDAYQAADADLQAISDTGTTSFGRSLLTMANGPALREAAGIVEPLPATGGTVRGIIIQNGFGGHAFAAGLPYTAGLRIYITENGADDPRTQVGDVWLEEAP